MLIIHIKSKKITLTGGGQERIVDNWKWVGIAATAKALPCLRKSQISLARDDEGSDLPSLLDYPDICLSDEGDFTPRHPDFGVRRPLFTPLWRLWYFHLNDLGLFVRAGNQPNPLPWSGYDMPSHSALFRLLKMIWVRSTVLTKLNWFTIKLEK